jgi:polar amino acid transport system ATP-binding protein
MSESGAEPIIRIEGLDKWFGHFQVLTDITLSVRPGERIVICGPSGSGKSTLIRCINRLETAQKGRIVVDGVDLAAGRRNVDAVRREVGMVFQQFNLFPHLTALQNCTLAPMRSRGMTREQAEATAIKYLTRVRIPEQASKYPSQLSGGQQQRVAVARAVAGSPSILLADEPTGNLDPDTSIEIMRLLDRINRTGTTIVMATHDDEIVDQMRKRVVEMEDGRLVRDQDRGVYGYTR